MKGFYKILLAGSLLVFIYVSYLIFSPSINIEDLKSNWVENGQKIIELSDYYNKIVPKNFEVYVEFKSERVIDLDIVEISDTAKNGKILWFQEWDVDLDNYEIPKNKAFDTTEYAPKTRSLSVALKKINWSLNIFPVIKKYLDKSNCISIQNGEPTNIGFQRSGFGKYFYDLFKKQLSISDKKTYNDSCKYVYYNRHLVLEYGGGAIGNQCFPDFINKRK